MSRFPSGALRLYYPLPSPQGDALIALTRASHLRRFSAGLITFFLLGIEELGVQIEEPFSILPMEAYCDASIGAVLDAMIAVEDKARLEDKARSEQESLDGVVVDLNTDVDLNTNGLLRDGGGKTGGWRARLRAQ